MKAGKKYVAADGNQYAMYPNQIMNITQSINGAYSHRGTNAIDDAQANSGISNGYAPCDMVCVDTDYVNGNAMFWESQRPVWTLRYGLVYIHIMVIHDNTANAYKGMKISQGQQLFSEGTAGNATGNHNHIEVAIGRYGGVKYVLNSYGVYMLPNNVDPSDVFFANDTQIINGGGLLWKNTDAINVGGNTTNYTVEDEHYAVRYKVDQVRVRKNAPNGEVIGYVNTGDEVEYFAKTVYGGHRWVRDKNNYWYAISGSEERGKDMWVDLIDPSEMKVNQKPTEPEKPVEPEKPTEPSKPDKPEFSDNPDDENFLENPDAENKTIDSQYGLTIENQIIDKSLMPYKCPFIMDSEFVVIHNAGTNGNPSADTLSSAMRSTKEEKSWHFSVDENKANQNLPLNRNSWATGDGLDGNGNRKGIQIEICRDMYDSGNGKYDALSGTVDSRYEKAKDNGALLAAILLNANGWDISHLKKHQDFANKYCPHHILNDGWNKFVDLVQSHLDKIQGNEKPNEPEGDDNLTDNTNILVKLLIQLVEKILNLFKK